MNILAIETSTERLSLALATVDRILVGDRFAKQRRSDSILEEIRSLCAEAHLPLGALDAVVYGEGPGAFTGLRIACGIAQGIAFGCGIPVLGIGTLEAVAEESGADRVLACLDARMGEVYYGAFEKRPDGWICIHPPGLYRPDEIPLPEGGGWTGCGSGFEAYAAVLRERFGEAMKEMRAGIYPTATAMLRLGAPRLRAGEGREAAAALPVYIRDKVALKTVER
jgi:tRNA threonylcarbamoyladenosine biosynthesis protein TsaB